MRSAHAVEAIRAAEAELMGRLPDGTLMQRAAAGLAVVCARVLADSGGVYGRRVVLLVGAGDNGGDALYAGARLARRGVAVTALLADPDRAHAGGLAALRTAGGRVADPSDVLAAADLVVDGITGIGGRGALRPPADAWARRTAACGTPIVAVDVPSGVDAGTGTVEGAAIRATVTVTFGTYKPGLLVAPGAAHAGRVVLHDIGLTPHLGGPVVEALTDADAGALLPMPTTGDDKYRRGVVGIVAGSPAYTGAAVLCVAGALRAGAGMVRYVGVPAVADVVRAAAPEVVVAEAADGADPTAAGRVQAWVIGPGHGTGESARAQLAAVLATDVPVLVDADALTLLADDPAPVRGRHAPTLLTPHAGELARLLRADRADIETHPLASVRRAADDLGVPVLLKGWTTLVAEPGTDAVAMPPVRANPTGTPWLATAGSGDVLAGVCGSLLAAGLSPRDAGSAAAYVHGVAGRIASGADAGSPIAARDIAAALPNAWAHLVEAARLET